MVSKFDSFYALKEAKNTESAVYIVYYILLFYNSNY
jgi:hypothetical protein